MTDYFEKVSEVMKLFNEAGIILIRQGEILGYQINTDRVHHTISNDPQGDWGEYPAVYGSYKFGNNANPRFVILSATLDKKLKEQKGVVALTHEVKKTLPDFSDYILKPEKGKEGSSFMDASSLAYILGGAARE